MEMYHGVVQQCLIYGVKYNPKQINQIQLISALKEVALNALTNRIEMSLLPSVKQQNDNSDQLQIID